MSNMQNIPNYQGQSGSTLQQMQAYIHQLTSYIAQNNHKYQKNMMTLKEFYEEQLDLIQQQKEDLLNDNSTQENQIMTLRDLLANNELKLKQNQEQRVRVERREEQLRGRLEGERERNQQMYEKMGEFRAETQKESERYRETISQIEAQNRKLSGQLAQKEEQLRSATQKINSLQNRLDEHYLLPGKIEDMQREGLQTDVKMQELVRSHNAMRDQFSAKEALVVRLQNQNESLRIAKGTFQADKKREIEEALSRQREQLEARIDKLEQENQSLIFQLNEAESRVMITAKEKAAQEEQIISQRKELKEIQGLLASTNQEKQDYLTQFGSLKSEYEAVIQRLEDAVLGYQRKNWEMEQENKDLNSQLESLRELLTEVKAINNLQVNKKEYRKLAEMQVMASRPDYPKTQSKNREKREGDRTQSDLQWEKLMTDIDNISA